jgi:hypothetical protein
LNAAFWKQGMEMEMENIKMGENFVLSTFVLLRQEIFLCGDLLKDQLVM